VFAYCVGEFRFSEDIALKRMRVARAAHRFPVIFEAMADGRLNLSAVLLLRPYLIKRKVAHELLAAAANKANAEIKLLLAQRYPRPDMPTRIEPVPGSPASLLPEQVAVRPVGSEAPSSNYMGQHAFAPTESAVAWTRIEPLAPDRFGVQVTLGARTLDKLRRAQELLSHQIPSGDVAAVLDRALDALIHKLERTKLAATEMPRLNKRRPNTNPRYIPAEVKRAVRERDGDRCTYVGTDGRRCEERRFLEFDHVLEVARGGQPTVEGLRLRCRPHNQFTAEQTFGAVFMRQKREEARLAAEARARAKEAEQKSKAAAQEVIPWLRQLGFRADEARRAAALTGNMDTSLEERVRVALSALAPSRSLQRVAPAVNAP
jgi:hypothetical protein